MDIGTTAPDRMQGQGSLGYQCIACATPIHAPDRGVVADTTCPSCGFAYRIGPAYIQYDADELLFSEHKKDFLLYKVLSNNAYIAYQTEREGSLSLAGRPDVEAFRSYIQSALPSGRVLDVGCGVLPLPGYLDFENRANYELYGLDPIGETEFVGSRVVGCSEYLPFPDESFDALIFATSLDHVCSLEKTAREVVRVLKDGGKLFIWMGDRSETLVQKTIAKLKTIARNVLRGYRTDKFIVYPNLTVFYVPDGAIDAFHSYPEMPRNVVRLMRGAGLSHENMQYDHRNQVFLRFAKASRSANG